MKCLLPDVVRVNADPVAQDGKPRSRDEKQRVLGVPRVVQVEDGLAEDCASQSSKAADF